MGGFGSGRTRGGGATPEACRCLTLDIHHLLRGVAAGQVALRLRFTTGEGEQFVTVRLDRDQQTGSGAATIAFNVRQWCGETGPQMQRIHLRGDPRPFGGRQWFFICPNNGRRAVKLYLPAGGKRFLSRAAWRLGYEVQRERPAARAHRRIQGIDRRLGHTGGAFTEAAKPPWMRWRTYARVIERRDAALAVVDGDMMAFADRLRRVPVGSGRQGRL
jgi:hypothetical protein